MAKSSYDPATEQSAALVHEQSRQPIASPADCAESGDAPELVLLDTMALKFQARGLAAAVARQCARDALGVLSEIDRLVCGGGGEPEQDQRVAAETLRAIVIKIVQAPKPRFSAGCLLLAMGAEHNGITSSNAWADRQQVSHELAADCVEDWQRVRGLPRNKWQKSPEARGSYKNSNGKQRRDF